MKNISIKVKIVSIIILALLITILTILFFSINNEKKNLLTVTGKLLSTSMGMLNQSIRAIMLSGEAPIVVKIIENLKKIQEINKIGVYRANGTNAFQDYKTLEFVNMYQNEIKFKKSERRNEGILQNEHFQEVLASKTPIKVESEINKAVEYFYPIMNFPECRKCHGTDHMIRGVGYFKISTEDIYKQIKKSVFILSSIFVIGGIILGLILIFSLKNIVITPLLKIDWTVQAVSKGNLDISVNIPSNDELGDIAKNTNSIIRGLKERTEEILLTRDVTIMTLASLAEIRDPETGTHILRTQRYVKALAENLKNKPCFKEFLSGNTIELLFKSAPLHDIGKVGVKDAILLKPGKLTDEEFKEMKRHSIYGRDALLQAEKMLGTNSFLMFAKEIAASHHEKWDGSGYPEGLRGEDIPISGRIMALADVYDALISKRVYKPAFPHEKTVAIIIDGRGSHFDPEIVDSFIEIAEQFRKIANEFMD